MKLFCLSGVYAVLRSGIREHFACSLRNSNIGLAIYFRKSFISVINWYYFQYAMTLLGPVQPYFGTRVFSQLKIALHAFYFDQVINLDLGNIIRYLNQNFNVLIILHSASWLLFHPQIENVDKYLLTPHNLILN